MRPPCDGSSASCILSHNWYLTTVEQTLNCAIVAQSVMPNPPPTPRAYRLLLLMLVPFQPLITLESSITFTFSAEGMNTMTVQVSAGNTILQDTKAIAVYGEPCFVHCYWFTNPHSTMKHENRSADMYLTPIFLQSKWRKIILNGNKQNRINQTTSQLKTDRAEQKKLLFQCKKCILCTFKQTLESGTHTSLHIWLGMLRTFY